MEHFTKHCPMCGHENEPMGILGLVIHYTCRMCGWWYSFVLTVNGLEALEQEEDYEDA